MKALPQLHSMFVGDISHDKWMALMSMYDNSPKDARWWMYWVTKARNEQKRTSNK